uniref:Uncharacterized protein n=1 Tax=uncultured marine type-A Synechococcus GOM 5D20 TaxID=364154 RepID=Q0QK84_9SYNE|nr:unknown [uncultured marine type-A Synechococcus GOM 5D20]
MSLHRHLHHLSSGLVAVSPSIPFRSKTYLTKGKTDGEALAAVVAARTFEGSKACIDFIRESSMNMREGLPENIPVPVYQPKPLWY